MGICSHLLHSSRFMPAVCFTLHTHPPYRFLSVIGVVELVLSPAHAHYFIVYVILLTLWIQLQGLLRALGVSLCAACLAMYPRSRH